MANVLVAVPSFEGRVRSLTAQSLCNLDWGGDEVEYRFVSGYDVACARTEMARAALDGGFDHLLMVDSDMVLPEDALAKLRDDGLEVAFGWYVRGSDEGLTNAVKPNSGGFSDCYSAEELSGMDGLVRVKGCGLGCALVDVGVFRKVPWPWFEFKANPDGSVFGEDYYFCRKLAGSGLGLYVDARVKCGHLHDRILG
jgi:hypothetical protein